MCIIVCLINVIKSIRLIDCKLAFKFFDSEGAALVSTLNKGSEELKKVFQDTEKLGLILDAKTTPAKG